MTRLIDADKLIEQGWRLERHGQANELIGIKSIADVPTAYDVDKVMEEVKKLGTTFCTCNCDNCGCPDCEQGTMMKLIVEAVKEGGINGRENDA